MFKPQALVFLKKTLGEDGLEELNKAELYKKKTNTVVDSDEIKTALQIVPRTILSFLKKELGSMKENEGKEVKIPIEEEAFLNVTKFANDVYSGEIRQKGEIVSSFKYRSLPGVGLTLMTSFELYDINDLSHIGSESFSESSSKMEDKVQDIIDERLRLRDLVNKVVDDRLSQRQALEEMVKIKLTQHLLGTQETSEKAEMQKPVKKPLKLKEFLDKKAKKTHDVKIEKSETVNCPDCGNKIFDNSGFSGCVCFGLDMNRKIHIKKSEEGVKLSFSNAWDHENIEMLLEVLKERKNRSKHE